MRENGISGTVGQAADAVSARTNSAVAEAKKLPGFVNKQTEVALDRVEDAVNQVSSWPIGKACLRCHYRFFAGQFAFELITIIEPILSVVAWCCAVQKVWGQAKPTADFAWKKYSGLHNLVVVSVLAQSWPDCFAHFMSNSA